MLLLSGTYNSYLYLETMIHVELFFSRMVNSLSFLLVQRSPKKTIILPFVVFHSVYLYSAVKAVFPTKQHYFINEETKGSSSKKVA